MNQQFLRDDMNKAELFAFIRHLLITSKLIIITNGSEVVCIPPQDTSQLAPSNHEEVDTRIILHMADAINSGFKKIFYIVMSAPATGTLQQWVKVTLAISFHVCLSRAWYLPKACIFLANTCGSFPEPCSNWLQLVLALATKLM